MSDLREAPSADAFEEPRAALEGALYEMKRVIVGQDAMLERLLVALLAEGHVLLEGVPGLAKTLTVRTLAGVLGGTFRRVQFTPDLVPADLVGTRVFRPDTARFDIELGPVFGNFLLADEINRAPAKVQSALLEVMQEKQVTIGGQTFPVPSPFLVLATQNPIESEGTLTSSRTSAVARIMRPTLWQVQTNEVGSGTQGANGAPQVGRTVEVEGHAGEECIRQQVCRDDIAAHSDDDRCYGDQEPSHTQSHQSPPREGIYATTLPRAKLQKYSLNC